MQKLPAFDLSKSEHLRRKKKKKNYVKTHIINVTVIEKNTKEWERKKKNKKKHKWYDGGEVMPACHVYVKNVCK